MSVPVSNFFLHSLNAGSRERVLPLLTEVSLPVNTPLYEAGAEPVHVYFLTAGFASQVVSLPDASTVEVGLIAREGVVGAMALLGRGGSPNRCFMQSDGAGFRMGLEEFRTIFLELEDVRSRVLAFIQVQAVAGAHLSACNKLHETEQRLARWLLMVQDRLETDVLLLRQEFLAQMLGTRRMTVTMAAGILQRSGAIEYTRGRIRILRREMLEESACECYRSLRTAYGRLYGGEESR